MVFQKVLRQNSNHHTVQNIEHLGIHWQVQLREGKCRCTLFSTKQDLKMAKKNRDHLNRDWNGQICRAGQRLAQKNWLSFCPDDWRGRGRRGKKAKISRGTSYTYIDRRFPTKRSPRLWRLKLGMFCCETCRKTFVDEPCTHVTFIGSYPL